MKVSSTSLAAALALALPVWAGTWTAVLSPIAGSRVNGSAVVESAGYDSTRASLRVSGAAPGTELPWHIHSGACGTKGQILGSASAYPALKAGSDGNATGTVILPISVPASGEYSVTVHKSKTDMAPSACGTLKPQATTRDTTTRP